MRDYTRKAKIKDSNEWVIGYHVYVDYLDKHYILVSEKTHDGFSGMLSMKQYEVDGDTICNPTGLTDKNGNKIWENDVVKQSFYIFLENEIKSEEISGCEIGVVVIIPTKGTCMKNPLQYVEVNGEIEKNFEKTKMYKGVCQYRCEVIGNIFDNEDLLKGE